MITPPKYKNEESIKQEESEESVKQEESEENIKQEENEESIKIEENDIKLEEYTTSEQLNYSRLISYNETQDKIPDINNFPNSPEIDIQSLLKKLRVRSRNKRRQEVTKLVVNEKLFIIARCKETSILDGAKYFHVPPTMICRWIEKLVKDGVQAIAPNKHKRVPAELQKHMHQEMLDGMHRVEAMKKYGVSSSFLRRLVNKYGRVPKGKGFRVYYSESIMKEIVRYAELYGKNAALIKYSVTGSQFYVYYARFGRKTKDGKRIFSYEDIREINEYLDKHDLDATLDKYCISRIMLMRYFKQFGYIYSRNNGKWVQIGSDDNIDNIDNINITPTNNAKRKKRLKPDSTQEKSISDLNYLMMDIENITTKTLTPHRTNSFKYPHGTYQQKSNQVEKIENMLQTSEEEDMDEMSATDSSSSIGFFNKKIEEKVAVKSEKVEISEKLANIQNSSECKIEKKELVGINGD